RDDAAAPRQLDDEPFARQLARRLADRPAAGTEALRELHLVEARTRRDLTLEDLVAQPVGDGLPELGLADGIAFLAHPGPLRRRPTSGARLADRPGCSQSPPPRPLPSEPCA